MADHDFTFTGTGLGNVYKLQYNHQSMNVFVGELNFKLDKDPMKVTSFCVDLDHMISKGQKYGVDILQTNTLPSSDKIRLAGNILNAGMSSVTDKDHAAAMQIAIWDEVFGNKFTLKGVSKNVNDLAQSYISNGIKIDGNAIYFKENAGCGQSQITTTPEPSSLAILGIGAIGTFFRRRKR